MEMETFLSLSFWKILTFSPGLQWAAVTFVTVGLLLPRVTVEEIWVCACNPDFSSVSHYPWELL